MADNTLLNAGTGGDTIGSDDIAGVKFQRIKLIHGADGVNAGDVSSANPLPVYSPQKATYRAATAAVLVTAVTAAVPWFIIQGSATKTIKVRSITISGLTLTAVAYLNIGVAKYSTAPTGGTATTLTKVPLDSNFAASTANLCQVYTAGPTAGTKVGDVSSRRVMGQATTAAAAGIPQIVDFEFSDADEAAATTLRGIAEGLGLYWITAPATAVSMLLRVEYTEE